MSSKVLFQKAQRLRTEEELVEAVECYASAAEVAHKEGEKWIWAESLHMGGVVYYQLKRFKEAKDYLGLAEELFLEQEDFGMIGAVLRDRAAVAVEEKELERAELLLRESIKNLESFDKKGHLGISKVKLGSVFSKQGKLDEAEELVLAGIEDIKDSDEKFFESSAYYILAQIQREKKQISEAKLSAERALEILEKITLGKKHLRRQEEMREFIQSLFN